MPSDALTVAVTTGLGVSVIAGLLSGICYILTHGLPNTRTRKPITPWHCNVCGEQFRSIQGILEVEKVVTCAKCKAKVCRVRCSKRDPQRGWICQICQQPENWFKGLLKSIQPNKDWFNKMDPDAIDELDEDLMELRKKEREQVRDFIERLVESMLGGNLDEVSVARVYNDKKYDSLITRYHTDLSNALTDLGSALQISISNLPITGQSPCSAHTVLKQLIQRFSGEASELPNLKRTEDHPAHPEETLSNRTYEDLLSTAIINKVVQTSQNEARSSTNSSSRASTATAKRAGDATKEYFFGEETLENKWRNHDSLHDDGSSVSSLDDWVRSDSSRSSSKYVDRVSLTIKQQIEEGGTSSDDDHMSLAQENSLLQPADDTWHENWYFQKRRLTNSSSPVPVPMLVPNPITEAKVFIGDKEAEQLSDIDSDYGDPEVVPDIKNILVNSKTIIGGKNAISVVPDEEMNELEIIETSNRIENEELRNEIKENNTEDIVDEYLVNITDENDIGDFEKDNGRSIPIIDIIEDISLLSVDSNTEQDTEYTEKYASLPRTISKSFEPPIPKARNKKHNTDEPQLTANGLKISEQPEITKISSNNIIDTSDSSDEEAQQKLNIFKGSYSEREKEKWKHSSVDIPDNPYSPENLERRLSSRSSNDSSNSIFGRDYYVKNAAKSAGTRKTPSLSNESEEIEYSPTLNGNEINSAEPTSLVTAVPALIDPGESNEYDSITDSSLPKSPKPVLNDISSDSDLSIERVYNLQSGKVFEKKGNIRQEISPQESYSPEGLKYVPKEFDEDIKIPQIDVNHNSTKSSEIANNKIAFMRSLTQSEEENLEEITSNEDQTDSYKTIDTIEEEDIVPYDDTKFKATLEMFKVSEKSEVKKFEKIVTPTDTEFKPIIPKATEIINEPISEQELTTITAFEPLKYSKLFDNKMNTSDYSEEEILSDNREFSLEYSTDVNDDDMSRTESSLDADPEINDLREKRLVKGLLDIFSRNSSVAETQSPTKKIEIIEELNQINNKEKQEETEVLTEIVEESNMFLEDSVLTETETRRNDEQRTEIEENLDYTDSSTDEVKFLQSVKDLKQLFDKEQSVAAPKKNKQQVYSLTARSLPKQFRQKLKSDDEISLQNEEILVDASPSNEESTELLPADITRNMIAFYEELGNKRKQSTS